MCVVVYVVVEYFCVDVSIVCFGGVLFFEY